MKAKTWIKFVLVTGVIILVLGVILDDGIRRELSYALNGATGFASALGFIVGYGVLGGFVLGSIIYGLYYTFTKK